MSTTQSPHDTFDPRRTVQLGRKAADLGRMTIQLGPRRIERFRGEVTQVSHVFVDERGWRLRLFTIAMLVVKVVVVALTISAWTGLGGMPVDISISSLVERLNL